jgi:hypothetical protein
MLYSNGGHWWWYQPGELHDSKGYPIYPGDLLKTFHFRGCRKRLHYLYHVARYVRPDDALGAGYMRMMNTCELEPTKAGQGGCPMLSPGLASNCEIVYSAVVNDDILCLHDRPKRKDNKNG